MRINVVMSAIYYRDLNYYVGNSGPLIVYGEIDELENYRRVVNRDLASWVSGLFQYIFFTNGV